MAERIGRILLAIEAPGSIKDEVGGKEKESCVQFGRKECKLPRRVHVDARGFIGALLAFRRNGHCACMNNDFGLKLTCDSFERRWVRQINLIQLPGQFDAL